MINVAVKSQQALKMQLEDYWMEFKRYLKACQHYPQPFPLQLSMEAKVLVAGWQTELLQIIGDPIVT